MLNGSGLLWGGTLALAALAMVAASNRVAAAWGMRDARHQAVRSNRKATAKTKQTAAAPKALAGVTHLQITPAAAVLDGPRAVQHLVVSATLKDGTTSDVTDRVTFSLGNDHLAKMAGAARTPRADGAP